MIRVAVVEDEASYREQFRTYLEQYARESGEEFDIVMFTDGDEIAGGYKSVYDIILMDVQMTFLDGMSAAEEIRKVDPEVVIIFITNMSQYAIRGYAVDALDYVLKPVSYFAFSQRLDRAIARMKKRVARFIAISVKGGIQKINVNQIYYVESQGHNMKETEERLKDLHFCIASKGVLINLEHVDGIQDGCAVVGGSQLTISRSRKNSFMSSLTDYMSEVTK